MDLDDRRTGVIGKVDRLLDAFGDGAQQLGLNELVRHSGLAKTTVLRLAGELVAHGFLERDGTDYQLGARLFSLGQRVPASRRLRDTALPFMEDLYVATREAVHLAVLDGNEVMYLERIAGHRAAATPSAVAGRLPAHCTATGKALLAEASADVVEAVLATGLRRRTRYTVVVPALLLAELADVRASGVAFEREETRLGYASVASAIVTDGTGAVAAISVTGPCERFQPDRHAGAVRTAALGISRALGTPPPA